MQNDSVVVNSWNEWDPLEEMVVGSADNACFEPTEPAEEEQVFTFVEIGFVGAPLLGPVGVDERVGEDPVQPRLQVRALLERVEAAEPAQIRLLHEVFRVGLVAGHPHRGRIELVQERQRVALETLSELLLGLGWTRTLRRHVLPFAGNVLYQV